MITFLEPYRFSTPFGFCYTEYSKGFRVLGVAVPRPLPASKRCFALFAAGLGLEPRYTVPETAVLPLDDPAKLNVCTLSK